MQTAEIRRRWLSFFADRDHAVVPSASLISPDPTLLFTVAGMVPFIPYLTGQQTPPWARATSVQKCVRTLDIDEVGKTTRHGTFFQMNGNFSFGDYFKDEAIAYAWELVTTDQASGGYGFDPDTIWVTVYAEDDEAAAIWRRVAGLPDERIQRRGRRDNYWHTGVPGPGGPCSEIYVDRGPDYGPDGGPVVDEDRFLEIWNLVFMQHELSAVRAKDDFDIAGDLPNQNIDTGMGLERVAYLLQGVDNLYEIDEVYPVIERACELAGKTYGADRDDDVRLRVVGDHVRSSLMLIGDGVTPGNEGRGYVLRRLLRRSVRAMRLLGVQDPALPALLPVSLERMAQSYPELGEGRDRICQIAYAEEDAFRRTLVSGTTILDTAVRRTKEAFAAAGSASEGTVSADRVVSAGPVLTGADAFTLHDTYGFPIDLTLEMAAEQGLRVDAEGFRRLMTEQRERAKADARAKKGGRADTGVWKELRAAGATEFRAYEELETDATVRGVVVDGGPVPAVLPGQIAQLVLDRTPFYAESGGQVADAGTITADGVHLRVLDVQRPVKGLIAHTVEVVEGELVTGAHVRAAVDREWRISACQAHSGTHVVHAALREVLGPTALQSGSYNKPGYLRLDFAWGSSLDEATRSEVEEVANRAVRQDLPVSAAMMSLAEAREIGALALFGETYDEDVRVVEIGGAWSRELCGGTHVQHSSQVGALTLTGESSVGSGVRRVEAFVGLDALRYLGRERALLAGVADQLKVPPAEVPDRVAALVARLREADKELERLRQAQLLAVAGDVAATARDVYGVSFASHQAGQAADADGLRTLLLDVRGRLGGERPVVVAGTAVSKGRPVVVVATNELARQWGVRAGDLVRVAAQVLGGGGGGRDDVAQGGGTDGARVGEALSRVEDAVGARVTASP
ncbi:MAG: alanine--tRNA ligase [Angustibacter sp.]